MFTIILMLAGYVAKPAKTHPTNTKTSKKKQLKNPESHPTKQFEKKSEDYYTVTSHVVLRFCLGCFGFLFFWFLWLCLLFLFFLVFGQGGRCKGKIEHFRSFPETFRSNRKFRKFLETEFVGVLGGGASFGTYLKAVLFMDYTRTLSIDAYMATGAFP